AAINREDLNELIRKWQGEIQGFYCAGRYENIVRLSVFFLAAANAETPKLSAKDIQKRAQGRARRDGLHGRVMVEDDGGDVGMAQQEAARRQGDAALVTRSDKLVDEHVDYNALEVARDGEGFPLRKGPMGFAVIAVDGEVIETLVPNATVEAHPKGGARKKPAAAQKKPGCAVVDSDDEERESSDERADSDADAAASDAPRRRPAAAAAGEEGQGLRADPPPEPRPPQEGKARVAMWHKRDQAAAVRQARKPGRQLAQWSSGGKYTEDLVRQMAAESVAKLSTGEIAEGEVRAKGLEFLRS
ncbi:unnamed protein product, partial [Prorocentrum cordatum]